MVKKKIKIGVAYHKMSPIISNDVYVPIQVGKALVPSLDLQIQPDNEGDNISIENKYYCELTATYWLWKNMDADFKGLCHYRRFYTFKYTVFDMIRNCLSAIRNRIYVPQKKYSNHKRFVAESLSATEKINRIFNHYAIIAPKKIFAIHTVYCHFSIIGQDYIEILKSVVKDKYPNFYNYLLKTLNSHSFYYANMVVMRNDYFDEYCEFMFSILNGVRDKMLNEQWICSTDELIFSRKLGYLAEILTSTYLLVQEDKSVPIKQVAISIMR